LIAALIVSAFPLDRDVAMIGAAVVLVLLLIIIVLIVVIYRYVSSSNLPLSTIVM